MLLEAPFTEEKIRALKVGQKVKVTVARGGKRLELDVVVGESRR